MRLGLRHRMTCIDPSCRAQRQFAIIVFVGAMAGGFAAGIAGLVS